MTYPLSFRQHALAIKEQFNLTYEETSQRLNIGTATLKRWAKDIVPKPGKRRPWLKIDLHRLARDIRDYPDAYHYERADRLGVSPSGICDAMKRLGITYKKSPVPSQSRRRQTAYLPEED